MASKNFTFSLRTRSPTPKIFVLRAEKFLVDYSIMRDWGITDHNLSAADVESIIDRQRISYIVFQPNFWTDQPSVAALQRVIDSDRFRMVAQFGITSDDPSRNAVLRVYRNLADAATAAIGRAARQMTVRRDLGQPRAGFSSPPRRLDRRWDTGAASGSPLSRKSTTPWRSAIPLRPCAETETPRPGSENRRTCVNPCGMDMTEPRAA